MSAPLRQPPTRPPALHDRAMQDISFIRRTMEGASSFTDVPGWGLVAVGISALGAAGLASLQPTAGRWIGIWMLEALIGALIGGGTMWRKITRNVQRSDAPLLSVPARKFLFGFWPAMLAGALLTLALIDTSELWRPESEVSRVLPGMWLLLYGVGITTAGAFSVRAVPTMGVGLIGFGAIALLVPGVSRDLLLALGFGAWQIVIGLWIARRHGG